MSHLALAYPRKHFFFEMFTRDISLEDCPLDLVDNSIDGLIRPRSIEVSSKLLREDKKLSAAEVRALPEVRVSYRETEFRIEDTCGGINRQHAMEELSTLPTQRGTYKGRWVFMASA